MRTFTGSRPAHFGRCLTTVTALASLALITACSGESGSAKSAEDKGVASVTEPSGKSSQAPAQAERPLIRPDTTEEEETRLGQLYQECQAQHGLAKYMIKNEDGTWKGYKGGNDELWEKAKKACASKEPETLPQRAAREDPEFQDKNEKWLKCMRSHGLKVSAAADNPGMIAFDDGLPPDSQMKWIKKCEADAFVAK
ncbi:hypothetical protein [Streptomyces sp. NBC_00878]|uniref:hypothetical protein n=1 Tax=Streptomyces sp. NBC_00878 TaxID=2975854 RepID=UPI00224D37BE|nr:hypothetical protein [Streptomyces sp. NBC_00878]MCX4907001.1 hypothetical protein [Streptomyces sp. NBC_00878]